MIDVRFESEMPVSIDTAPGHGESAGWSAPALGEEDPRHYHLEGQLLYASGGVLLVEAAGRRWGILPQRALWIPPLMEHSSRLLSHTELRAVYLSGSLISQCTHFAKNDRVDVVDAVPLGNDVI